MSIQTGAAMTVLVTPIKPTEHDLKCWPEFFDNLASGCKRFEVRKNDRVFSTGDELLIREWHPVTHQYSGREIRRVITYVLESWPGIAPGYVVLSIKEAAAERFRPGPTATWKHTVAGPELFVNGVLVREWLGTSHDAECQKLCDEINAGPVQRVEEGK
jgi:hypothetical protein